MIISKSSINSIKKKNQKKKGKKEPRPSISLNSIQCADLERGSFFVGGWVGWGVQIHIVNLPEIGLGTPPHPGKQNYPSELLLLENILDPGTNMHLNFKVRPGRSDMLIDAY